MHDPRQVDQLRLVADEQLATEEGVSMTTLDDLKKAIAAVPPWPEYDNSKGMLRLMTDAGEHHARRADAWHAYAKLLENWVHCLGTPCTCDAAEAHRLVQEKLK